MNIIKTLPVLLLLFIPSIGYTQSNETDSKDWQYFYDEGISWGIGVLDYEMAIKYYKKAIKASKKEFGTTHTNYGITLRDIAYYYHRTCQTKKAIKANIEAIEVLEKSNGKESMHFKGSVIQLIGIYEFFGYKYIQEITKLKMLLENK